MTEEGWCVIEKLNICRLVNTRHSLILVHASRCNNFHGNVAARMNSINANKDTFKMYTDMFLAEYIILAIHLNSQGALSDVVLNKVKKNANLMV